MGGGGKGGGSGKALAAQVNAINQAIATQKEQFNFVKDLMAPYTEGGEQAFGSSLDLLGLGEGSQQEAIDALTNQDYFKGLVNQGEQALLQNASATGGLRGGNTQAALAQFRPSMIANLVQQQLSNLGGITATGMQAGGTVAGASQNYGNNVGNMQMQIGSAIANQALMKGSQQSGLGSAIGMGAQVAGVAGGLGWQPFSDIRLKSNIRKIGSHKKGFGIYEYDIFGNHEVGVLAQEVQQYIPSAIKMHPSGYLTVNYGAL